MQSQSLTPFANQNRLEQLVVPFANYLHLENLRTSGVGFDMTESLVGAVAVFTGCSEEPRDMDCIRVRIHDQADRALFAGALSSVNLLEPHACCVTVPRFLSAVVELAQSEGFIGAEKARARPGTKSTGEKAFDLALNAAKAGIDAVNTAKAIVDRFVAQPVDAFDGIEHSIATAIQRGYVTISNCNIVASSYAIQRRNSQRRSSPDSEYVGSIGERRHFELELVAVMQLESDFSGHYLYLFEDADRNSIVWRSSGSLEVDAQPGQGFCGKRLVERGERIELKATISGHEIYKHRDGSQIKTTYVQRGIAIRTLPAEPEKKLA